MSSYNPLEMKEIVKNYDALIFDIWGVLYDGVNPYPGAIEYLNSLGDLQLVILYWVVGV